MTQEQFDLGFVEAAAKERSEPDLGEVREDAQALIDAARSVSAEAPWDAAKLRYNRLIFPHLVSWLPAEEAKQLCFAFEAEARRIEQLLAA
ncbi:MAG TPA: hypothetical protein PKD99_13465 [Sphingopyxis sp.]|nr:hypothetical protein [Sphingopyxis sp.]HMP46104.1 hypothetical protein [Sphingopyxis sp.]HMQ18599.1 hypothetical protein [Sphingopyxis sp.]